jgi:hypothetical protein
MLEGSTLKAVRLTQLQACPKIYKNIVPKFFNRPRIHEIIYFLCCGLDEGVVR